MNRGPDYNPIAIFLIGSAPWACITLAPTAWHVTGTLPVTPCNGTICDSLQFVIVAQFVTTECFNLWPGTIFDQKWLICDRLYIMILECKLWRGKLVFVFTLIMYTMYTELYNMMHIYELWCNICTNGEARILLLFYINTVWISCMTYTHHMAYIAIIFNTSFVIWICVYF